MSVNPDHLRTIISAMKANPNSRVRVWIGELEQLLPQHKWVVVKFRFNNRRVWHTSCRTYNPSRQTCKVCYRPDKFNFNVPDDVWMRVVPERFRGHVVCLYCFDEFAREADEPYADSVEALYFAGDRAVLTFRTVQAVDLPRVVPANEEWYDQKANSCRHGPKSRIQVQD